MKDYKPPKEHGDEDDTTKKLRLEGCAPTMEEEGEEEEEQEELLPYTPMKKSKKG